MSDPLDEALMAKESAGLGTLGRSASAYLHGFMGGIPQHPTQRAAFSPQQAQDAAYDMFNAFAGEGNKAAPKAMNSLLTGAGMMGGAATIGGISTAVKKLTGAASKRSDFKEMMELNSDLQEVQDRNPRFFNASYDSIRRLNPTYGKDPVVAGSILRKMMESPETAGTILTQTVKPPEVPKSSLSMTVSGALGPLGYEQRL